MELFKQELQTLLAKYPDIESVTFKATITVTAALRAGITAQSPAPLSAEDAPIKTLERTLTNSQIAEMKRMMQ